VWQRCGKTAGGMILSVSGCTVGPNFVRPHVNAPANWWTAPGGKTASQTTDAPIDPQSAYGDSKWMIERALHWADQVHGLRFACLRYFNAAGADPAGRLGEDHRPESHLIPLVIDAALGRRPPLDVYGEDYPTPDGTCIRDYVHVSDLAEAHLLAVRHLDQGSVTWNLGNGAGHSVRQVIAAVERVSGLTVPHRLASRRPGDAAVLVASSERARLAGWRPVHGDLDDIVRTAFDWRRAHPGGYGS